MSDTRLIVYHKHSSSARILFLRLQGTVCLPQTMETVAVGDIIAATEEQLGLPPGSLAMEEGFSAEIESSDRIIPTYLARLTMIDPPLESITQKGGKFIAITEARTLPPAELKLLGLAYSFIME